MPHANSVSGALRRDDLDHADRLQHLVRDHERRLRVEQHLERRELGVDAGRHRQPVAHFELVRRVELDLGADLLLRRRFEAERGGRAPALLRRLRRERARERLRVVLEHDHARERVERVEPNDGALLHAGGAGKSSHKRKCCRLREVAEGRPPWPRLTRSGHGDQWVQVRLWFWSGWVRTVRRTVEQLDPTLRDVLGRCVPLGPS